MAQVGPPCTCGAGYMRRYRANTKNNNGHYFYCCPQFKNKWDSNVEDVVESAIEELGEELSLLDVGQFSHGVNDVEESPESASNGGNGPSGSGV
ncbi:hypothetical protein GIB67_010933 [Kingdonia uniflora]|uniref:Uncharacterized protein n=1 Tax=Kingdonia uniflora TaxID=39325 RepID=A0A7J7M4P8_9MAGN|nr:hypothetical protein GIB67_010933 [Kingdonia uniflora]